MFIVIVVLNGIEISHKLFTPQMVVPALSIRHCESVLGIRLPSTDVDYNFDMVGVIPRAHARYLAHPKLLFPVRVRMVNNGAK